jgi:iron complex outermembrane recepter protein
MRMRPVWGPAIAGAVLMFAGLSEALANETETPSAQKAAADTGSSLDEVIVTAQRRAQRLQDVPLTITAQSAEDLQRGGVDTTRDLPNVISGLTWSNQGTWIEPNIRGVYTSVAAVGSSSPVAIYLDGIYQPSQSGTILDLPDVSRIEVVKGPQGTLFGQNATGGAIQIFTLDPTFTTHGNVEVAAGDYFGGSARSSGHYVTRGFVTGPLLGDTLAGSLSADYDQTAGYYTNDVTGQRDGRIAAEVVRGKLLWKPADNVQVLASAYYSRRDDHTTEDGFPLNGVTIAAAYPGSIIPTQPWHVSWLPLHPDATTEVKGASVKTTAQMDAGTLTSLTGATLYAPRTQIDAAGAYAPACIAAFACTGLANIHMGEQAYSQELDFASRKYGLFSFVAGVFWFHDHSTEDDNYSGVFSDDTAMHRSTYAAYTEVTLDATDKLSLIGGARLNRDELQADGRFLAASFARYADKSWESATPRFSARYAFSDALSTYFTYSEGFKAGVASGQITAAPPANPEKLKSYEMGVKAATRKYAANLALFAYDYQDLQVEVIEELNGVPVTTPQNAAKARIYGVDLDASGHLTDALLLRFTGTWLPRAEYSSFPNAIAYVFPLTGFGLTTDSNYDASGSRMLTTPVFTGSVQGTYTWQTSLGRMEGTATVHHSDQYRWEYTGRARTGGYTLLDSQLSLALKSSPLLLTLYGKNLTNKAYVQGMVLSYFADIAFYAPPREVGVRASYSF